MDFPSHLHAAFEDNFGFSEEGIGAVSVEVDHGGHRTVSYHEYVPEYHEEVAEGSGVGLPSVEEVHASQEYCDLGEFITELSPEHVRWFYKTETDKKWSEFNGYDSLRIEEKYRELYYARYYTHQHWPEHYEAYDQAYFEGYDGDHYPTVSEDFNGAYPHFLATKKCEEDAAALVEESPVVSSPTNYEEFKEAVEEQVHPVEGACSNYLRDDNALGDKIVVRGGLYEVDLQVWKCFSTYWPGEVCDITRGTWFYVPTWQPLSMEEAEKLEEEHMKCFGGHSVTEYVSTTPTRAARPVLHTMSFLLFHVDWITPTEIYLYHETAPSKLVRSVTQRLGFQKPAGHQLSRGFKSPALIDDKPTDVSHLVFVIHGIGQKMDTGRIVRNCSTFRDCITWLKQKYFPHADTKERAEFFPVEWRSSLKLDGDIVELITPQKVLGLRQILNATAMDIMYYTSPIYRGEIQRVLQDELNRLYKMFCERNPTFEPSGGKVSVLAHSLGAVIMYDIITGWTLSVEAAQPFSSGIKETEHLARTNGQETSSHLSFRIENFFCIGSPLSVFLALRWKDPYNPGLRERILPKALCRHILNIFHPSDPVAYRIEPLIIKHYSKIAPLQIHAYNAAVKTPYKDMPKELIIAGPPGKEVEPKKEKGKEEQSNGNGVGSPKSPGTPSKDKSWSLWNLMRGNWRPDSPQVDAEDGNPSQSEEPVPSADLEYRMDYVLREGNLISSSYLSALTSHTAYWGSLDVAYFVLTHLYNREVVSPDSESSSGS